MRVALLWVVAATGAAVGVGCGESTASCTSALDCIGTDLCVNGACVPRSDDPDAGSPDSGARDAGSDRDVDRPECAEGTVDLNGEPDDGCECRIESESCDRSDNDCDGVIDESVEGEGAPCGSGVPGCDEGVFECMDGALVCRIPTPEAERCNGADDDCDGSVDEGVCGGGDCEAIEADFGAGMRRFMFCPPNRRDAAAASCEAEAMTLVVFRNDTEVSTVASLVGDERFFIGLRRGGDEWRWEDGSPAAPSDPEAFTAWAPGQPEPGGPDCAVLQGPAWRQEACDVSHAFICAN